MCTEKECYLVETGFGFEINGERGFSRGHYIPYRTVSGFIENRNRYSVFCSAYRYNTTDINKSDLYGDLYLDFDNLNEYDKVKADALTALSCRSLLYSK